MKSLNLTSVRLFNKPTRIGTDYGGDALAIVRKIVHLKTDLGTGKISKKAFWKKYYPLRDAFYNSASWRELRRRFLSLHKSCNRCSSYSEQVHHKKYLVDRPDLALSWSNLEPICTECHRKEHQ